MSSRRSLTLRGTFVVADNARVTDEQIFSYEANDLTRGWILREAYIWPASYRGEIGSADGQYQANASLATDEIGSVGFDEISNVEDNRQVAWCALGFQLRAGPVSDFLSNSGNGPYPARFVIDPGTVVANGLYLNFYSTSESSTSPDREWNYMVVLEPKKLDPKETILHLIKNYAQDVDN